MDEASSRLTGEGYMCDIGKDTDYGIRADEAKNQEVITEVEG